MDKTAWLLLALAVVVLVVGMWSIFSETLWVLVSCLETMLYPTISTPE
ncbi:Ecr family regulatory small membrane protein [Enterobacter sp. Bisph1]|nr:Ecr family regulatory small membrane protein [Enterobacter sp. Bisph1]